MREMSADLLKLMKKFFSSKVCRFTPKYAENVVNRKTVISLRQFPDEYSIKASIIPFFEI